MAKSDELFVLVKSLSRSEKRYFKLFCKQDGANYIQLFDAIDGQETYDETAIKKKFKNQTFIKQLHVTKNYLHRLVLKSLRDFHAGISKDAEVKDCLRNIEILFNKELYGHCRAELKRAEQMALDYDLNSSLADIYSWKRRLEQQAHPHNYTEFGNILQMQEQAIHRLANSNTYWQLANSITTRLMQPDAALPDTTLLQSPANALSLEARVLHYNSLYFTLIRDRDYEKAEETMFTLIDMLEAEPHRMREEMGLYASSVNNLISFLVFRKKHRGALKLIQRAQQQYAQWKLVSENKTLLKQVLRTYNVELEIYRDLKTYDERAAFIDNIEQFIIAHENKMPRDYLLSFYFQLAYIRFMMRRNSQALQWTNKVLNNRFQGARTDLQVQVRLLNLMVHLEHENMFVLRNMVDSAKRFMNKVSGVKPYEKVLLKFFSKMGQAFPHQYKGLYTELYRQLFPAGAEPLIPPGALDYIDYKTWIEKKLTIT